MKGVVHMLMDLEQTYKAVLLKGMFEQRLKDLEEMKNHQLKKGQLDKLTLKTIAISGVVSLSVIFLSLNYFLHGRKTSTLFFYPLHVAIALTIVSAVLLIAFGYNQIVKSVNMAQLKKVNHKSLLVYEQEKEATEINLKTITEGLKTKSKIPVKYHEEFALEKMIEYIQTGKAKNVFSAIYRFDKEYPSYFKTLK